MVPYVLSMFYESKDIYLFGIVGPPILKIFSVKSADLIQNNLPNWGIHNLNSVIISRVPIKNKGGIPLMELRKISMLE